MNEQTIFSEAIAIESEEERGRFLDAACGDNVELRRAVQNLLELADSAGSFLEHPALEGHDAILNGIGKTIVFADGSTCDDDGDEDAAEQTDMSENAQVPDDEIPLGYLEPATRDDSIGRLGHYEILNVVGKGAFGTVLRAFDTKLERIVAIKVLALEMASMSPARKRFLREARTSAQIRHENVVGIYSVEEEPIPYLVMEYIPGKTLQQQLDGHGPLDIRTVLRLGKQIADGLAAAHAQDLIHRDIKPGNILLEGGLEERIKITDFGLARTADDASMTQSGTIAGTPMYMAPEQALGRKLDQRADLFSFGSVLYQMLSGRPPFRASTTVAVLKRVVDDQPRPIREIIPEVPEWLCDLVEHLHAKNPDERYQSAREVSELLGRCAKELEAGRIPLIPNPSAAERNLEEISAAVATPSREPSRRRSPLAKVAVAAIVLLGVLGITEATGVTKLATTVIRIARGEGTLIVEVDDPSLSVTVDRNGDNLTVRDGTHHIFTLRPGEHDVLLSQDGQTLKRELVSITRNGRTVVRMSLEQVPAGASRLPTTDDAGFADLFNRVDLTGWKTHPELPGGWDVKDGILEGRGQPAYLFSERGDYANFHLRAEFRVDGAGDAGLFFRAPPEFRHGPRVWMVQPAMGYEAELSDQPKPRGTLWQVVPSETPQLLVEGVRVTDDDTGDWVTLELIADGNQFTTRVNGHETVRATDSNDRYQQGHFVLSAFGNGQLQIRKLEIRELPPPPPSSAPRLRQFASEEWIDVVPIIDPQLDRLDMRLTGRNEWRVENGELIAGAADDHPHKLVLPIDADFWPSFECELEFTRRSGDRGINLNFPTDSGDTPICFEAMDGPGVYLRHAASGVVVLTDEHQIETGQRTSLRIEVRRLPDGNRVTVWNGNQEAGVWRGDRTQLVSITGEGYPHQRRVSLWIHRGQGEYVFHRIRLRMLDWGTAHAIRPAPATQRFQWPADAPPPAIAPFDAEQAKKHQEAWAKYLGVPVEYENSLGMKFRLIPPGDFTMGSTPEELKNYVEDLLEGREVTPDFKDRTNAIAGSASPQHRVVLTQPIYLGIHEVTQHQFEQVLKKNPSAFSGTRRSRNNVVAGIDTRSFPVEMVSWDDAVEFCSRLSEQEQLPTVDFQKLDPAASLKGTSYRLPTEAEWEFTCRAGTTTRFWVGDSEEELLKSDWLIENSEHHPHPVGELRANPFGLFDVHGNIQELVLDLWSPDYYSQFESSPAIDPLGPTTSDARRVSRGGRFAAPAFAAHSSKRGVPSQTDALNYQGFRVALSVDAVKQRLNATAAATSKPHQWPDDAPPPAIAPFDAAQAKAHQTAWAKYLGVQVEKEIVVGQDQDGKDVSLSMALVPPGEFLMGSSEEQLARYRSEAQTVNDELALQRIPYESPIHRVKLTQPFYLAKYETTQFQWLAVMGANPAHFHEDLANPVESVGWNDVMLMVEKLNEGLSKNGVKFALPSEAQWEFACRAGTSTSWYGSDSENDLPKQGWFLANSEGKTHPTGNLSANPFGLHDMHGNVFEWCADWFSPDYYARSPLNDPTGPSTGFTRVHRGGCWINVAFDLRTAHRHEIDPDYRNNVLGFRLAASLPDEVLQAAINKRKNAD